MDVRNSLALQAYAQSRLAAQPQPQMAEGAGAGAAFAQAVEGFHQTLAYS